MNAGVSERLDMLTVLTRQGGLRSVRSVGGSFDRIDRSVRSVFDGGRIKKQIRDVEICQLSNFQPPTTFGGRKNVEKPKNKIVENFVSFGSVGSISLSVRSVLRRWVFGDRHVNQGNSASTQFSFILQSGR